MTGGEKRLMFWDKSGGGERRYSTVDTKSPAHALVLALILLSEGDPVARSLEQFPRSALIDL